MLLTLFYIKGLFCHLFWRGGGGREQGHQDLLSLQEIRRDPRSSQTQRHPKEGHHPHPATQAQRLPDGVAGHLVSCVKDRPRSRSLLILIFVSHKSLFEFSRSGDSTAMFKCCLRKKSQIQI